MAHPELSQAVAALHVLHAQLELAESLVLILASAEPGLRTSGARVVQHPCRAARARARRVEVRQRSLDDTPLQPIRRNLKRRASARRRGPTYAGGSRGTAGCGGAPHLDARSARHQSLADVAVGEHGRRLDLIPVLLGEGVGAAHRRAASAHATRHRRSRRAGATATRSEPQPGPLGLGPHIFFLPPFFPLLMRLFLLFTARGSQRQSRAQSSHTTFLFGCRRQRKNSSSGWDGEETHPTAILAAAAPCARQKGPRKEPLRSRLKVLFRIRGLLKN